MNRFWTRFTGPLITLVRPRRILEIGAEAGLDTRHLLAFCRESGCHLDIVETVPSTELQALLADHADVATLHVGKSLDISPTIPSPDVVMLDGDHNWRTVYSELTSFRSRAQQDGRPLPIVLAHDCAWPYARRDMYYNPADFPESQRKPYAYKGIRPGVAELDDDGMNAWYANAIVEGGPENGVLTGIEDFVAASTGIQLWTLPFFNGLGIIVPDARMTPELRAMIDSFYSTESLLETCRALEEDGMNARCLIYEERRKLEQRTDALERARRLLADRAARIAELEATLAQSGPAVA